VAIRRSSLEQNCDKRVWFRCSPLPDAADMAPIDQKQRVERRMLQLIEDSGLPEPDEIRYGEQCVEFLWLDRKVAVVVDLEDSDELDSMDGYSREGITS
jgi:hypothetical protein